MVQYIFTPWRDRSELLMVRRQFYPARTRRQQQHQQQQQQQQLEGNQQGQQQHADLDLITATPEEKETSSAAVARVSMWMQRGNCPHLVESTALLMAAILDDERQSAASSSSFGSSYAVRAAYSAAFSRFVTGLLDSHQDKARKMSMYGVAKSVGLPATFVELRHQATHEQLPSLIRLRVAARKALDWIWDYYWRELPAGEGEDDLDEGDGQLRGAEKQKQKPAVTTRVRKQATAASEAELEECREVLARHLATGDVKRADLAGEISKYGEARVLVAVNSIADSTMDTKILRRAMALSTEMAMESSRAAVGEGGDRMDEDEGDDETSYHDAEGPRHGRGEEKQKAKILGPSWSLYEEDEWIPKPIGVV